MHLEGNAALKTLNAFSPVVAGALAGLMAPPKKISRKGKPSKRPDATKRVKVTTLTDLCVEAFSRLPKVKQNMNGAILETTRVCNDATQLSPDDEDTYIGYRDFPGIPQIPDSVLEMFNYDRSRKGLPPMEVEIDEKLPVEYVTNLVKFNVNQIRASSIKYLGMRPLPGAESRLPTDGEGKPCAFLVDFIYNVLKLELRTPKQIEAFVTTDIYDGLTAYLLDEREVDTLIKEGEHEDFTEDIIEEATEILMGLRTIADAMVNFKCKAATK